MTPRPFTLRKNILTDEEYKDKILNLIKTNEYNISYLLSKPYKRKNNYG